MSACNYTAVSAECAEMQEIHASFRETGSLERPRKSRVGKLPAHVKRVCRRGREYFYLKMGVRADGRAELRPLPHIALPQFAHEYAVALAERQNRPPPVWVRPERSQVYFIGGEVGAIKIGWARRAGARLKELQTGSPIVLAILGAVDGGYALERKYHLRFAAHRLHGEWFARHPDILAEIDRLNAGHPSHAGGIRG